jgi:hypothetical protein
MSRHLTFCQGAGCPIAREIEISDEKSFYCSFHNARQTFEQVTYISKRMRTDLYGMVHAYCEMQKCAMAKLMDPVGLLPPTPARDYMMKVMQQFPYDPSAHGTIQTQMFDNICALMGKSAGVHDA